MIDDSASARTEELFEQEFNKVLTRTDRMFGYLMLAEWLAAMVLAYLLSSHTWVGAQKSIHPHFYAAVFLGGGITILPVTLAFLRPGKPSTRYTLAVAQGLWSGLLIHITGGRIETHFHIFGSLAFLAFYRDLWVLLPAGAVVLVDHVVRGLYWPESIYGVSHPAWWRFLEHGGWVVFIDVFLIRNCLDSYNDLRRLCQRQAELEASSEDMQHLTGILGERFGDQSVELEQTIAILRRAQEEIVQRQERETGVLKKSREELYQFLGKMPVAVYITAGNGVPVYANEEALRLLGDEALPGKGDVGESYSFFLRGTDTLYDESELPLVRALKGESFSTEDIDIDGPLGRTPVYAKGTPICGPEGEVRFALVVFEDISEKIKAEQDRLQGQKLKSVGQLAAGVAHEINTPMQYIGDNISFLNTAFGNVMKMLELQHEAIAAEGNEALLSSLAEQSKKIKLDYLIRRVPRAISSAQEGVESVSKLVRAMKEFSHPGTGEKTLTDINRAIETAVTVSTNEWKYVANIKTDLDKNIPLVPCLPGEFNQVILNMIVNASHAIADNFAGDHGEKGEIRLSTKLCEPWVEVYLSDTGSGMPESVQDKIFDPFFTTKGVGKGTGQGLAIAHSIVVDKHGGTLAVDSQLGRGTTFTIRLPLISETDIREEAS